MNVAERRRFVEDDRLAACGLAIAEIAKPQAA
jgi:hypothetical protein